MIEAGLGGRLDATNVLDSRVTRAHLDRARSHRSGWARPSLRSRPRSWRCCARVRRSSWASCRPRLPNAAGRTPRASNAGVEASPEAKRPTQPSYTGVNWDVWVSAPYFRRNSGGGARRSGGVSGRSLGDDAVTPRSDARAPWTIRGDRRRPARGPRRRAQPGRRARRWPRRSRQRWGRGRSWPAWRSWRQGRRRDRGRARAGAARPWCARRSRRSASRAPGGRESRGSGDRAGRLCEAAAMPATADLDPPRPIALAVDVATDAAG